LSDLIDNTARRRFEMAVADDVAFVNYAVEAGRLMLLHAEVPQHLEGHGVGKTLVRAVLEEARRRDVKIVPVCSFVALFIRRNPEFGDLVWKASA